MTFFDELKESVREGPGHNSNFEFNKVGWVNGIWMRAMCELIDKKLDEMDEKIYDKTAIQKTRFRS